MHTNWSEYWQALRLACDKHNATARWQEGKKSPLRFIVRPAATEAQVLDIEKVLETSLPESLRNVMLTYSSRVDITWELPDEVQPPKPLHRIWSGECCWDIEKLPELQQMYREHLECFCDPDDPYDAVWHNKFPIAEVSNGDMIGIETAAPLGTVVYLSHEDTQGHGYWLGSSFEDYVERSSRIGCPGYEDDQWWAFTTGRESLIDPTCKNAVDWRQWFGLEIE